MNLKFYTQLNHHSSQGAKEIHAGAYEDEQFTTSKPSLKELLGDTFQQGRDEILKNSDELTLIKIFW